MKEPRCSRRHYEPADLLLMATWATLFIVALAVLVVAVVQRCAGA